MVLGALLAPWLAQAADPAPSRVDAVFAAWDKPDSPGVALAVVREGQVVYSRGYGSAHLEYDVPITPRTVFHAASVSKQFTAFAIQLLAQERKLSLDDDVRKHVPELRIASAPITLRHLLHHTSGLRDQWSLLMLAGLRLEDTITERDILGLLWQQRELNFAPGEEELYSNSGYTLLGLVVQRVSGQSLAAFTQERIFGPLGMKNTHFHEHYGSLVKGRAYSYQRQPEGGWRYLALSYSNVGATSLFTTVEDLALWDRNFQDMRVGGPAVMAAMHAQGRLNNGRQIAYASGLGIGRYRSLPVVEHSGSDAAYRAYMLRFPEQKTAVLLLGNASDVDGGQLARRVADLYLEGTPGLAAAVATAFPPEIERTAQDLAPFLGPFEMLPGFVLNFSAEGSRLFVQATSQPRFAMFASAPERFFTKAFEASVQFGAVAADGKVARATWYQGGRERPLRRIERSQPGEQELRACTGQYYSAELRTLYHLTLRDGKLRLQHPRGEAELEPVSGNDFAAGFPIGTVRLQRSAAKGCEGLSVTSGRVRNLRFVRVELPAP